MSSFEKKYIQGLKFPVQTLSNLRAIGEYKGKEELYSKQSPDALEKLLESVIIESTESSNRIEGITAPHERVKMIVEANVKPRNRPEQEIAGYRDVLNLIHGSHEDIPLSENVILQFHSMLYRYTTIKSGFWKKVDNEIIERKKNGTKIVRFKPVSARDTPLNMKKAISLYKDYIEEDSLDALILISLFIFDFLCIHPFQDGNGRIARLLTLLLLYQSGYGVGRYISLERITEDSRDSYYDSLGLSSKRWHESQHDIFPWLNYFHGTLLAAYKEFEKRVGVFKAKGSKREQIKAAIERFVKPFSIIDIERACPNVSRDMIRKILRELRDAGDITATSMGRGAKWVKNQNK